MSYIFHEHNNSTSAIDKYWIFQSKKEALRFYREMIEAYLNFIDYEYYQEEDEDFDLKSFKVSLLENENDITIYLIEDDYLVFSKVDSGGFARRG